MEDQWFNLSSGSDEARSQTWCHLVTNESFWILEAILIARSIQAAAAASSPLWGIFVTASPQEVGKQLNEW